MLCCNALHFAGNAKYDRIEIGASGCKAICGALERNTNVAEWWHISTWIQSRSVVVLIGFWLKGGKGGDERVLQCAVGTLCRDVIWCCRRQFRRRRRARHRAHAGAQLQHNHFVLSQ